MDGVNEHDLLPLFVANALPDDERDAFAGHLERCTRCRAELSSYEVVLDELAAAVEVTPPPALRAAVLDSAARTPQVPTRRAGAGGSTGGVGERADPSTVEDDAISGSVVSDLDRPRPVPSGRLGRPRAFAFAAALVALALVAVGALSTLAVQRAGTPSDVAAAERLAAVVAAPDARLIDVESDLGGSLRVVASAVLDEVVVVGHEFTAPPDGSAYQLWVVTGDEARSAGLLAGLDGVLGTASGIGGADAVAVSVEPASGSDVPTGPIVVEASL